MDATDFLTQFLRYILGIVPGDIAANVIAVITTIVTICTLIMRFWKEPEATSKLYKLWKLFHVMASFKKAIPQNGGKVNEKVIPKNDTA